MDKRPEYQKVVIDGDTLEKRREQRAEQMEKFIWQLTPEQRVGIAGKVNQWTEEAGTRVVPASQSVYNLNEKQKQLREYQESFEFDAPPIIKRTPEQRLDSMVKRLTKADPAHVEPILREIREEYWKAGAPISVEQLRAVATHFLNRAERKRA
jgi:RNase P/RNase MRP subunit p29